MHSTKIRYGIAQAGKRFSGSGRCVCGGGGVSTAGGLAPVAHGCPCVCRTVYLLRHGFMCRYSV